MTAGAARHEECWLLLPWLANGRLTAAERAEVEEHVRACADCAREVAWQQLMCQTLAEPDRVSYAPGPSLRKLFERIDGRPDGRAARTAPPARPVRRSDPPARAAWRPVGLSWAAGLVLVVGLAALLAPTAYRWSQPLYATHTAAVPATPDVLHIAFQRSLTIGEVEELLHTAGARVVEGPDATGIFGVTPVGSAPGARAMSPPQMRALAARLRTDARVRWVEPGP